MSNFNKVYLMGNLTRDPEVRHTTKGTCVTKIAMAVNRKFKTEAGEAREEVTFIDIEAFGKLAEVIGQHCKKGRPLFVEGRLKLDQWDDKTTGQKRSALKVVLEAFQFIGGRQEGDVPTAQRPAKATGETQPTESDDVPF
jgi:single-strand DNA-binding protein